MKQPESFTVKGNKELVCRLKKSLYELKQSPSKAYHCVYFKLIGDHVIYLVLYVDDMLLTGNEKEII